MSIAAETARSQYTLTSTGQTLSVPWYFLSASDLKVVKTVAGVDTTLTLTTHYSVSGAGVEAGGSITLTVAAAAIGNVITIYRNGSFVQGVDLTYNDQLPAASLEQGLDRATMLVQQLKLSVDRSLRIPVTNAAVSEMTLATRASKVVGFDSSGNLTFYAFTAGTVLPISVEGTADQVLVNGGSGSAVTGALILTLPQSIGTGSTVRFGKLGINGSIVANTDINVTRSVPSTTAQASVVVTGALTAAYDLHPNAFRDTTTFTPTVAGDAYCSYDAQASVGGAVALNHYHGYQCRNVFTGSDTLGYLAGYATTNMGLNGTGTMTFMRGFYVSQPTITGGGTVGQFDGIYMDALTNSTGLVNAIYIAGANNVFMAGGQFGNSALLTYPAGATTCRGYFTFDQATQTGLAVMNSSATATGTLVSFCNSGGTVQGTITQTNSTTVAYNTSSDGRLKENIRALSDSGAIVDALSPCIFDWKWGGENFHGFIAQELAEVYPEAVTVGSDETNEGGALIRPWGVDFAKLVPVLTAEIKSLRQRVAELEAAA